MSTQCRDPTSIREFYRDQSVFITGASGFLGKVLVEKLLRSCSSIKHVYLLMRPKNGCDIKQRLDQLCSGQVFQRLKKEQPTAFNKIVPICGDVTEPELGICASDFDTLVSNVGVVFHLAATVRFDEPLRIAIDVNTLGTKRVIQLCRRIPNLKALIHVSTAYTFCNRTEVGEEVYPLDVSPSQVLSALEWMKDDLVSLVAPNLLSGRPNSYTFAKALAERVIVEDASSLPVAILRPSIVIAAWKEPVPGWIDSYYGPSAVALGIGKGLLRTICLNPDLVADVIPVDVFVNTVITAAWYTATHSPNKLKVYNCTSGGLKKVTWGECARFFVESNLKNPLNDPLWIPFCYVTKNKYVHAVCDLLLQELPAIAIDTYCLMTRKKQIFRKIVAKIRKGYEAVRWFSFCEWEFSNDNLLALLNSVPKEEKELFPFDITKIDWGTYSEDYCIGLKKFIMKEDVSTLPAARQSLQRLYIIRRVIQAAGMLFLLHLVSSNWSGLVYIWDSFRLLLENATDFMLQWTPGRSCTDYDLSSIPKASRWLWHNTGHDLILVVD